MIYLLWKDNDFCTYRSLLVTAFALKVRDQSTGILDVMIGVVDDTPEGFAARVCAIMINVYHELLSYASSVRLVADQLRFNCE